MGLKTRPLAPAIGREVIDLDLSKPLDDATFEEIKGLFNDSGILLFRNQNLTEEQHIALSRRFGPLQSHVLKDYLKSSHPEILVVSNILDDKGRPIGIGDAGQLWHSDTSYLAEPCHCSLLYAREIPAPDGERSYGDTAFATLVGPFEALSPDMKNKIANKRAVHSYEAYYIRRQTEGSKRPSLTKQQKDETPDVVHPLVRPHPITGRNTLFVNESYTVRILDMKEAESDALLSELIAFGIDDRFVYRHKWRKGDLILWDNWSTQHLAIGDYALPQRRLLHRTTVLAH
ncbi:MAG: TauD/TfdA family dioxygenase [Bradyrhizobium sp.]